jgi:hypothetical protein
MRRIITENGDGVAVTDRRTVRLSHGLTGPQALSRIFTRRSRFLLETHIPMITMIPSIAIICAYVRLLIASEYWRKAKRLRTHRKARSGAICNAVDAEHAACRLLLTAGIDPRAAISETYMRLRDGYGGTVSRPLPF